MKVLVCGGRKLYDRQLVFTALDTLHDEFKFTQVIHGAYYGTDALADAWARSRNVRPWPFPAGWQSYGRAAGPMRNQRMITQACPGLVVAFPGGVGTADMVDRARKAHVPIKTVSSQGEIRDYGEAVC